MARRTESVTGARQWLGNLLVAWTMVTGMALVLSSAWYSRTGDLRIIIAYLGAPFLVGTCLFLLIGVVSLAGRTRVAPEEERVTSTLPPHRRRERMLGALDTVTVPRQGATAALLHPGLEVPPSDRVRVEARPTEEDLTELHRLSNESRHARLAVLLLATAAAVGWPRALVPEWAHLDPVSALPLAYLGGSAAYLGMLLREPRRRARDDKRPPARFDFDATGFTVATPEGNGRYAWSGVRDVRETRRLLLLRTREGRDLLIPKQNVGEDAMARLRVLMSSCARASR